MILELGHTYQTRNGNNVRIICVDRKGFAYPVIGLMSVDFHGDGFKQEMVMEYQANGRVYSLYPAGKADDVVKEVIA